MAPFLSLEEESTGDSTKIEMNPDQELFRINK